MIPRNLDRRIIHYDGLLSIITFNEHRLIRYRNDGPSVDDLALLHWFLTGGFGRPNQGHELFSYRHRSVENRFRTGLNLWRWWRRRRFRLQYGDICAVEAKRIMRGNVCPIR